MTGLSEGLCVLSRVAIVFTGFACYHLTDYNSHTIVEYGAYIHAVLFHIAISCVNIRLTFCSECVMHCY